MHIKSIQIQGFKSYKDQTFDGQFFSPKHNVIVGRNGYGKSNFFAAIQFVLSEKYSKLKQEERQALLHEGSGRGVMTAFVEIVFDNSDSRLPIEKKEVALRRTIGLKKDEFKLDGKAVTQREVTNLLETAGFSSSNPYYIVEQGKVSLLTIMKDHERLELLKEVAGTRVYDERRKESLKIMTESQSKIDNINEVIQFIDDRIKELETEKKEFAEYQALDNKRRALEYTIFDKELKEATDELEEIESSRERSHTTSNTLHGEKVAVQENLRILERDVKQLKLRISDLTKEKEILEEDRQSQIRTRTKLQLELTDSKSQAASNTRVRETSARELQEIQTRLREARARLSTILPRYDSLVKDERELAQRISEAERRISELFSKQGRQLRFKTAQERDQWIRNEISDREAALNRDTDRVNELSKELDSADKEQKAASAALTERNTSVEQKKTQLNESLRKLNELRDQRDELTNIRKNLWKDQADIETKLKSIKEDLSRNENALEGTFSRVVQRGVNEVRRIVREQNIEGVYGTVIELFECDEKYNRAVEVTAGGSLYNIVVDSDEVAANILTIMNRQKADGRVTFMPLNRLNDQKERTVAHSADFVALWKKLQFEPKFEKVFIQIFGKTYVCKDIAEGAAFARENGVNCVTLKGDQVSKKGAITGGYIESRGSRLDMMKSIREARANLRDEQKNDKKVKTNLAEIDNRVNITYGEYQKLETEVHRLRSAITQETSELRLLTSSTKTLEDLRKQKEESISRLRLTLKSLQDDIASLRAELGTQLVTQLNTQEQTELNRLSESTEKLKSELQQKKSDKIQTETEKTTLENTINSNLSVREIELTQQLENLQTGEDSVDTSPIERELARVNASINDITSRQTEIERKVDNTSAELKEKSDDLDKVKAKEAEILKKLEDRANSLEKLLNKRKIYLNKKEEALRKIRDLGALPDNTEYEELSIKEAMYQLQAVNDDLKRFGHVNKKAMEQYEQFTTQRKEFTEKKKELDKGAKAIDDLIKSLDKKKDEAILRTFKQVSENFATIFAELVPGGSAELVMKKSSSAEEGGEENDQEEEEGEESSNTSDEVRRYSGVGIRVQFVGAGEASIMQQLSGGQKTLVALTLILAIQQCDPAPFYLFDEIDSALDAAYRTSIARMIQRLSEKTQFITTTFKTELVDHADQYYKIHFKNKVSTIKKATKEEALEVLLEEERELQRQQQEQAAPLSAARTETASETASTQSRLSPPREHDDDVVMED